MLCHCSNAHTVGARNIWGKLWDDLIEVYEMADACKSLYRFGSDAANHYLRPEGASRYTLIDGHTARMTSVSLILLSVIRKAAQDRGDASDLKLADEILETCLINKFIEGDGQNKLLPTQRDREDFFSVCKRPSP